MSPEELAEKHPRLYHLTSPLALEGIRRHGLLPTSDLLNLFAVEGDQRTPIERTRRATSVEITHPVHGRAVITDNGPLSEKALLRCLDDGLSPEDWLLLLNNRVFFWPEKRALDQLLAAKLNRGRERLVLVVDTLRLVTRHARNVELTAINTGSTIMNPARRGLSTFVPLSSHSYREFCQLRRKRSKLREVTVVGGVPDLDDYLVDVVAVPAADEVARLG